MGIYHYGARFYSSKLGRFLSADSIVPGASNPQAFNRYSYVLNNPLVYIDPSGHKPCRSDYLCKRRAEKQAAKAAMIRVGSPGDIVLHTGTTAQPSAQSAAQAAFQQTAAQYMAQYGGTSSGAPTTYSVGSGGGSGGKGVYSPRPQDGGGQPCTINGVNTSCNVTLEVNATASNLRHLAQHYDNMAYEIAFAAGAAALIGGPLGLPLTTYFGWEATNMAGLADFYDKAAEAAEKTASGTIPIQRYTSDQTYGMPSIAYYPANSDEGTVHIPVSPFTFIAIAMLKVR